MLRSYLVRRPLAASRVYRRFSSRQQQCRFSSEASSSTSTSSSKAVPPVKPPLSSGKAGKLWKVAKFLGFGLASLTLATAGYMYVDEGRWRGARFLGEMVNLSIDYGINAPQTSCDNEELNEEDQRKLSELHKKWAKKTIVLIFDLKGYFLKLAQTLCGAGYLPREYEEEFEVLLDQVPARPFSEIQSIVNTELGCELDQVFSEFSQTPIGAAAIGQVHLATLRTTGKQVVVKVQYPDVEKYFRMDFMIFKGVCKILVPEFDSNKFFQIMEEGFQDEFNYIKEATYLRNAAESVTPHFKNKIYIPLPLDEKHPDTPAERDTLCK